MMVDEIPDIVPISESDADSEDEYYPYFDVSVFPRDMGQEPNPNVCPEFLQPNNEETIEKTNN